MEMIEIYETYMEQKIGGPKKNVDFFWGGDVSSKDRFFV